MSLRIPICLGNASTVAIFDKNLICLGEKSFPTVEKCVIIGMYVPQTRYIGITTVNDGSLPKCDAMEKSSFALSMRLLVPSVAMQYSKETKIIGFTGFGFCSQLR